MMMTNILTYLKYQTRFSALLMHSRQTMNKISLTWIMMQKVIISWRTKQPLTLMRNKRRGLQSTTRLQNQPERWQLQFWSHKEWVYHSSQLELGLLREDQELQEWSVSCIKRKKNIKTIQKKVWCGTSFIAALRLRQWYAVLCYSTWIRTCSPFRCC